MSQSLVRILAVMSSAFVLNGCGPTLESIGLTEGKEDEKVNYESELLTIDVSIDEGAAAGFRLASASKFNIELEGCASGYTSSLNELSPGLNAYRFDRDCKARLVSLEYSGISYTVGAIPFSTLEVGDSAEFVDASGTNRLRMSVISQLSNPVTATDKVAYSFVEIQAGEDKAYGKNEVASRKTMSVGGQEAPSFNVKALYFSGMAASGAGEFRFELECLSALGGSGVASVCNDLSLSQLKYTLVKDTFGGDIDADGAAAIFAGTSQSIVAADVYAPGSNGVANGGFTTSTLVGPNQMHLNPNMILIVQGAGTSYLYFNVDVTTISASDSP